MTEITLDSTLAGKLTGLTQVVQVRDPTGRVLGRFVPELDPSVYEGLETPIRKEELQRRKQFKGKSYTTKEVLKHLEKL